jgi:hypothetical protein
MSGGLRTDDDDWAITWNTMDTYPPTPESTKTQNSQTIGVNVKNWTFLDETQDEVERYNTNMFPISEKMRDSISAAARSGVESYTLPAINVSRADEIGLTKSGFRVTRTSGCEEWQLMIDGKERLISENMITISWRKSRPIYV